MKTPRSLLMDDLYGTSESRRVYEMIQGLDPQLNEIVQKIAYDYFWALPGLSIKDKSMVTVTILLSQGKEAQTRPHMMGFLNTGGTVRELSGVLIYLSRRLGADIAKKGFDALCDVLAGLGKKPHEIEEARFQCDQNLKNDRPDAAVIGLAIREAQLIGVITPVALANAEETREKIKEYLGHSLSEEDLRKALIHAIVYCGFPTAINGFFALKAVLDQSGF